ncbi:MAG: hypothetical protein DMF64_02970 [Acidobacteria bacterium]|nr:MAG: hypothetical protein DMF64_02970 [Acidobacteriota bacterium]
MGDEEQKIGRADGAVLTESAGDFAEFEEAYEERLADTLNLATWTLGEDVAAFLDRTEQEIADAIARETAVAKYVREIIFPQIPTAPHAPKNAGRHEAQRSALEKVHRGLLFNGAVEACDGTRVTHDTLPLTITQIGVCLVSYNGQQGSWAHRLYRRDLRARLSDPVEEVLDLLHRRQKRGSQGQEEGEQISELAGRGIMTWAERAILRERSTALWRMGHGHPVPYELLTNLWSSSTASLSIPLELIEWYVAHKRFVFVPSAPSKRHWLTLGYALRPLEFLIVQTLEPEIEKLINTGHYRETRAMLKKFSREVASQIVVGLYRTSLGAPPFVFYAHVEQAEMAAHIAMADSLLQEHRGFPMLIDLADTVCRTTFGVDSFKSSVQMAYARAGTPFQYLGERETRAR